MPRREPKKSTEEVAGSNVYGRALRVLRESRGLTQEQLADRSGVNKATLSNYERGEQPIKDVNLRKILDAVGLPLRAFGDTVEHVTWIDWMVRRHQPVDGPEPASAQPGKRADEAPWMTAEVARTEIDRIATVEARARQKHVTETLEFLRRLVDDAGADRSS